MPKGTLLIRAAEQLGISIPRFCDHPLLDPAGACRQCLVEVTDMGNGRGMPKPAASCTTTVMPGMVIKTQLTSVGRRQGAAGRHGTAAHQPPARLPDLRQGRRVPAAEPGDEQRARRHPLPREEAHLPEADRDLVATCCSTASAACCASAAPASPSRSPATRSSTCSSAAPQQQIGTSDEVPFQSYFSGNTVQICPVGALTGASYRFRARPFDLQLDRLGVRALLVRLRAAHRLAPLEGHPPAGR